jgi:hypothetical protein
MDQPSMTGRSAVRRAALAAAAAVGLSLPTLAQTEMPEADADAGAAPASATDPAADDSPDLAHPPSREALAWEAFHYMDGGLLPPEGRANLVMLAWHAAMANLCHELVLDHERFGAAFATLEHADAASLSGAEHEYFRHHLAVNFGIAVGILLAEMAGSREEVEENCEAARAYASDASAGRIYFDVEATFRDTLRDAAAEEGVGATGADAEGDAE